MDRERILNLIPAYVLGALSGDESAEVEALLATDSEAQQLLEEYQAVADTLVLAAPSQPAPSGLRDDLRRRLQTSSQTQSSGLDGPPVVAVMPIWKRYPVPLAAALALIVAGLVMLLADAGSPETPSPQALYNELAAAEGSRSLALVADFDQATYGDLIVSSNGEQAVIRVHQLPVLTDEQAFQLWLIDDEGSKSGGVFQFPDPEGPNYIELPLTKPVDDYLRFGVSIEPAEGSPLGDRPTGPRAFGVAIHPQQSS